MSWLWSGKKWKRGFEYYLEANKIVGQREKRSQLLFLGGADVQEIFESLPGIHDVPHVAVDPPFYDVAIQKLDAHFQSIKRRTYERHVFRQIAQQIGERFSDFVMKLRMQANRCDFDQDGGSIRDSMIIDQIAEKCLSAALRKKILEKDRSLSEVVAIGKTIEDVELQCKELSSVNKHELEVVNKINTEYYNPWRQTPYRGQPGSSLLPRSDLRQQNFRVQRLPYRPNNRFCSSQIPIQGQTGQFQYRENHNLRKIHQFEDNRLCFGCGHRGHAKGSEKCRAKEIQCLKCGILGHFAKWCTKRLANESGEAIPAKRIKAIYAEGEQCSTKSTANEICYVMGQNIFQFKVGGVPISMAIDSGAAANLIDLATWTHLHASRAKVRFNSRVDRSFKAYGSDKPLKLAGKFTAEIEAGGNIMEAIFYVVEDGKQCLLGDETAKKLNVLKIGFDIGKIQSTTFPKMKGILIEIPIDLNVKPVQQPYRRVPFALEDKIGEKLRYLLEQDIIELVDRPSVWVSLIVPVVKDSGEVRLCVDMRRANNAVLREIHPLPIIEELFSGIDGATRFSKLDIQEAYHQVEIAERSREITTFVMKQGLFRYKRLMFGISCAPEIFQKVMESIVAGLDGVIVYLDDIMVVGRSQEEHDRRLKNLLERFEQYNILLNQKKCIFNVTRLEFLGHELSENGIRPTESKIEAIKSFREPRNVPELRSFLGLITYIGRFIPHLADKTEALRDLLRTGNIFKWTDEQQEAFNRIKLVVCQTDFLGYFSPKDLCIVIADASPTGIGAVLLQQNSSLETRIITFASKALTDVEKKYFQTEKEALALVWAVDKFHLYLLGKRFRLVKDCKPLQFLFKERTKPNARIERWVLRLQAYSFDIVYEPGVKNLADAISRLSIAKPIDFDVAGDACIYQVARMSVPEAITLGKVEAETLRDNTLQQVITSLNTGIWNDTTKTFKAFETELCQVGNLLLRGDRLVLPELLRHQTLEIAHESHPGMVVMKRRLRQKVWWPRMDSEIESFVRKCKACTLVSAPDQRTEMPLHPWTHIAADFLGPLPSGHNLLVLIDYHSRFTEIIIMKQITATLTVRALHETFCRFGMPESLKTDNGPQFISAELHQFCNQFGIEHRRTTPYWPQANGEVERINRSIGKRLKISQETEGSDWEWDLKMFVLMHNSTPHSTTEVAPSALMFGRILRDKLPGLMIKKGDTIEEYK
ncbi:uncharacterized protein K02A2.6-like [Toxorhynchites rutilus septentrionalis]|uniref:uncharacterized protein K02A2.6-like n=1 Tax=Toxorhynchites rutilus septentrionalis TaxID=329112 RepID=UPI00247AD603|nr:uncharacterized protein K02A2.6-like [Toxorhynchites rutilus septentrionalis]XP_055635393.1 uncharacterized protein K02A2.6-like [Toxorhynchites rutilus septentrionalis]XP_055635394.1 uncharacterized protein K02A2.6-like [Toxorhynchites rutilus septentrionalis]